ncbi:L-aspartate oxidase [Bacillus sp. SCS-151]|uniref:L-aspartate oxidase n=1 Tax=Nanhaiella sioensis TaxID=3115293 RepID=UPI00397DEF7C
MPKVDVIIIGSGISALVAAERLCKHKNVIVITKSTKHDNNSSLAQGGVACVVDENDHWMAHYYDTVIAGRNHNNEHSVKLLVQQGPFYIQQLIENGMQFDRSASNHLQLGKEGAHRASRILHAGGDATGRRLMTYLHNRIKDKVTIIEDEMAIDLLVTNDVCTGVITRDSKGQTTKYYAVHTVLATGGCGGMYSRTSNNDSVTGDGLAMAFRAGAQLVDLEFIQFHPTMLYADGIVGGLVSEAVRGEGAKLVTKEGRKIMEGVHELGDLAPRDVVSRVIYSEMNKGEEIFLDISTIDNFNKRFPTITKLCQEQQIDLNDKFIPVVPGAHFLMGGIRTDHQGKTSIKGLYAVGETACTGVHGANRLASNSLLEGIVFSQLLSDYILQSNLNFKNINHLKKRDQIGQYSTDLPTKQQIQAVMMQNVGIVRDENSLFDAKTWFEQYLMNDKKYVDLSQLTNEQVTIINMVTVGWLISSSALLRTESRGGHYRTDYPSEDDLGWLGEEIIRHKYEASTYAVSNRR